MAKIDEIGDKEVGDEDDGDLPGLLRDIVVWLFQGFPNQLCHLENPTPPGEISGQEKDFWPKSTFLVSCRLSLSIS